jgi:hypothetical protein
LEIYEKFNTGTVETGYAGTTYNGWNLHRGTSLASIFYDGDRVLAGKVADTGSKRLARPLLAAGEPGRISGKWKIASNLAADYAAANNFYDLGFMINTTDVTSITGANKRAIMLSYEGAGSNVGIKFWNGTANSLLLTIGSVPTDEWLQVTLSTDGSGRYTAVIEDGAGTILASGSYTVAGDGNKDLWAYVDFGYTQATNQNTWGTQVVMKDVIARNDFTQYDQASERRILYFSPMVNADTCYVHIPANWNPDADNTKVIIAGHGYNATLSFTTMLSKPFPEGGYVYGMSNTHGNTWGNTQATSDLDGLRLWIMKYCKGSDRVHLNGSSMGCLVALNYASKYRDKVRSMVGEIGVASLRNLYLNATFQASIQAIYGVSRFGDIPKEFDPIRNVERYVGLPIMLWAGTNDTTVPHGLNTKPFAEKLGKLGGTVLYIEEPGEDHSLDVDAARYLDFYNAQQDGAQTKIVRLDPSSVYRLSTTEPGSLSYLLYKDQGSMTTIPFTDETIKTKDRYTTIMLKTTGNMKDVTVTKL